MKRLRSLRQKHSEEFNTFFSGPWWMWYHPHVFPSSAWSLHFSFPEYTQGVPEFPKGVFCCCCSVAKSCLTLCDSMDCTRFLCPPVASGVCSNSHPLSQWCYQMISPTLCCPFSFAFNLSQREAFPMSLHFASGGWSIGASASASVLPMSIQGWFPLGVTCCPRDFQESSPAPWFWSINCLALCLLDGPPLKTVRDYWRNHSFGYTDLCRQSDVPAF